MGDWPLLGGQIWEQGIAQSYLGDVLGSPSSANTKYSWVELIASTSFPASGLIVTIGYRNVANFLIDVGIGAAGSEITIINDLLASIMTGTGLAKASSMFFPISIPAGTRIAARCQSSSTSNKNCGVAVQIVGGGFVHPSPFSRVITYGADTGTSRGVNVDPGSSADTKGAWVEISAATSDILKALLVRFGDGGSTRGSLKQGLLDVGIGAAGSEIVAIPNIHFLHSYYSSSAYGFSPDCSVLFPVSIPSGYRLAVRAQSQETNATYRKFDVALYGLA
jgi:hypothetical protein